MDFDALVRHIKEQGCRVRIYKKKKQIDGNVGTFHVTDAGPLISLAIKNSPTNKNIEYLLHEFGHFLQWQNGYMETLDSICDAYTLWYEWVNHKIELTPIELQAARNVMLAMEWDAEIKALECANILGVSNFNANHHLSGANAYIMAIKWGWLQRKEFVQSPKRKKIRPVVLTQKKLFAPLTEEEKEILKKFYKTQSK